MQHTSAQPVALVTGTSSGMGLHAAIQLAEKGHTVVATMRDLARADGLRRLAAEHGVDLDVRTLDVTDAAACTQVVDAVVTDHGHLDLLVNNAGRGSVRTLEQLTDEQLQEQLDVNYLGVARMTRAVLPHMRGNGRGRVVTVTSVGGVVGQPFADAYCAAKFAVEGLMQSLAPVMSRFGVEVSVVEPGAVATSFVDNAGSSKPDAQPRAAADDPYAPLLTAYLDRMAGSFSAAQTAEDAARAIVEACTAPWRFRWQTTEQASGFAGVSLADLDGQRVLGLTSPWLDAPTA